MFPGRKMKLETYFTQGGKFHRVSNLKVRNNARAEGGNRVTTAGRRDHRTQKAEIRKDTN